MRTIQLSPYTGQKNWTPFVYNGSAMFIVHINPLTVAEVVGPVDLVQGTGLDESSHRNHLDVQVD